LAAFGDIDIEVRHIRPGDRFTGLSLGDGNFTALKIFLQRHALAYEKQSLSRTYAAFNVAENDRIAGCVTLVCGEVVTGDGDAALVADAGLRYPHRQYPAIKIARLAVDRRVRGVGLGEGLVNLCLAIASEHVAPNVGCRFVVVDSKKEAVPFYDRLGFTMLDTPANREREEPVMFVDLGKVCV